ncbi:MAG: carboxypeptidase regulatory-like domain-containing protein [Bacteroidales bacterium]|nr:carboxypeptidase regulatory-like domain-containing protein [Bacteroidales bacterium]
MKKLGLFFMVLLFSVAGFSQITITSDNAFDLGDEIIYRNVFGADAFDPGAEGANVVWDFTDKAETNSQTVSYIDTTGLPMVGFMPNVDVAEQIDGATNGYFYYDKDGGDGWRRSGFYANEGGVEMWVAYDPTSINLNPYPFTWTGGSSALNYSFVGAGAWDAGYGVETDVTVESGSYQFKVDGYGTLMLPHKTYHDALRVKVTETFDLKLWADFGAGNTVMSTAVIEDIAYYWFVEGVEGPVMSYVESSETTSKDGKGTTYSLKWYRPDYTNVVADFSADITTGTTDDVFTFYNETEPLNNNTWTWSFSPNNVTYENATSSTSVEPQVKFTQPGTYTVALTATNTTLGSDTETKVDYITVTAAPELVADFIADNTSVATNGIVDFTSDITVSTGDPLQGTTTYQWAVSPGTSGVHWGFVNFTSNTSENPSIQFYQAGCYSIQMIATNSTYSNSPVTITKMNYISAGGGCGSNYTVTFTVTDGTNPISGAIVSITGQGSATTNSSGVATFDLYNGTYNYSVSASGYETNNNSFTVSDANVPVDVTLVEILAYDAVFTVTDGTNPVSGATVTVTGEGTQTTDGLGVATFSLYDGSYDYTVDAPGYDSANGNFTISAGNEAIPVTLTATEYTITFNVTDGSDAINLATITVDGYSAITTDVDGNATIDLVNGDYDFDVTATGFNNYSSSFTVDGIDDNVDVVMTPLSLTENNVSLLIYPNPSTGIINIVSMSPTTIRIISPSGVIVYQGEIVSNGQIDMRSYSKGLYFINYELNGKTMYQKIIIK